MYAGKCIGNGQRVRGSAAAPCGECFQPRLPKSVICPHDGPADRTQVVSHWRKENLPNTARVAQRTLLGHLLSMLAAIRLGAVDSANV